MSLQTSIGKYYKKNVKETDSFCDFAKIASVDKVKKPYDKNETVENKYIDITQLRNCHRAY